MIGRYSLANLQYSADAFMAEDDGLGRFSCAVPQMDISTTDAGSQDGYIDAPVVWRGYLTVPDLDGLSTPRQHCGFRDEGANHGGVFSTAKKLEWRSSVRMA